MMNVPQLRTWLGEHAGEISQFTDYEVSLQAEEQDLCGNLGEYWFRDPDWNQPGYRFFPLGQDGTGGEVAVWWTAPSSEPPPVVFFGSEGGSGVVAASPLDFVRALAYGPIFQEYQGDLSAPSRLARDGNWLLKHPKKSRTAAEALAQYREATERQFGELPPFDSLTTIHPTVQSEFRTWVVTVQTRVSDRDARDHRHAVEQKRQTTREKASFFAARSASSLPPTSASLPDGSGFEGTCAACQRSTNLRLVHFEEFSLGLCIPCYFSKAW